MMRSSIYALILVLLACTVCCAAEGEEGSTDMYIKQLKDPNPDVRAKAAYELSCG